VNREELDKEIVTLKQRKLELSLARERTIKENRLSLFRPNPKQRWFFEKALTKRRGGFCGNRFGKSTVGVVEDASWLLGERPFFDKGDPLRRAGIPNHGVKGLLICEEWGKAKEIFTEDQGTDRIGKLIEYLPSASIVHKARHQTGALETITVENKLDGRIRQSVLYIETVQSFMKNRKVAESSDWDFVHIDEPVPEDLWKAVSRGLIDRGGFAWWLLTPLSEPWMYMRMVERAAQAPELWWFFEATMDDNPLLSEEDKALYLEELTEEERECRRLGKPLAFGRLVYGQYDEARHLWQSDEPPHGWVNWSTPPVDWMTCYALDPHPQTPCAILFAAVSPSGEIVLYDEVFQKSITQEIAGHVKSRRERVTRFEYELADPWLWQRNMETGRMWVDTLWGAGLFLSQGSKEKQSGIIEVNDLLKSPRPFKVFPHLANFRREIKTWFYDRENKPVDKDDHMMENFRRLVQYDGLRYHKPPLLTGKKPATEPIDYFATLDYKIPGDDGHYTC